MKKRLPSCISVFRILNFESNMMEIVNLPILRRYRMNIRTIENVILNERTQNWGVIKNREMSSNR